MSEAGLPHPGNIFLKKRSVYMKTKVEVRLHIITTQIQIQKQAGMGFKLEMGSRMSCEIIT